MSTDTLQLDESRQLLRFLDDLRDAFKPLQVAGIAGLASVDLDLADELAALSARAEALNLTTARARLDALREELAAIPGASDLFVQTEAAVAAWDGMQGLTAWMRLLREEVNLQIAEANLLGHAMQGGQAAGRTYPTATLTAVLYGLTLTSDDGALWYGVDVKTRQPVILRDRLSELHPDAPLRQHAVSWLFQAQVIPRELLHAFIHLKEQPVARSRDLLTFSPGFKAVPTTDPLPRAFQHPDLPGLKLAADGGLVLASGAPVFAGQLTAADLDLSLRGPGGDLRVAFDDGAPCPLQLPSALRLNLLRLLLRDAERADGSLRLPCVVLTGSRDDASSLLLATSTPLDGRVFPTAEPHLFRLTPEALLRRARALAPRLGADPRRARLFEACAARMVGSPPPPPPDLTAEASPTLHQLHLTLLAGDPLVAPEALPVVRAALASAASQRVPAADLLAAVELSLDLDDLEHLRALAEPILQHAFADPNAALLPEDHAARALLIAASQPRDPAAWQRASDLLDANLQAILPFPSTTGKAPTPDLAWIPPLLRAWDRLRALPLADPEQPPSDAQRWTPDPTTLQRALRALLPALIDPAEATDPQVTDALHALHALYAARAVAVLVGW